MGGLDSVEGVGDIQLALPSGASLVGRDLDEALIERDQEQMTEENADDICGGMVEEECGLMMEKTDAASETGDGGLTLQVLSEGISDADLEDDVCVAVETTVLDEEMTNGLVTEALEVGDGSEKMDEKEEAPVKDAMTEHLSGRWEEVSSETGSVPDISTAEYEREQTAIVSMTDTSCQQSEIQRSQNEESESVDDGTHPPLKTDPVEEALSTVKTEATEKRLSVIENEEFLENCPALSEEISDQTNTRTSNHESQTLVSPEKTLSVAEELLELNPVLPEEKSDEQDVPVIHHEPQTEEPEATLTILETEECSKQFPVLPKEKSGNQDNQMTDHDLKTEALPSSTMEHSCEKMVREQETAPMTDKRPDDSLDEVAMESEGTETIKCATSLPQLETEQTVILSIFEVRGQRIEITITQTEEPESIDKEAQIPPGADLLKEERSVLETETAEGRRSMLETDADAERDSTLSDEKSDQQNEPTTSGHAPETHFPESTVEKEECLESDPVHSEERSDQQNEPTTTNGHASETHFPESTVEKEECLVPDPVSSDLKPEQLNEPATPSDHAPKTEVSPPEMANCSCEKIEEQGATPQNTETSDGVSSIQNALAVKSEYTYLVDHATTAIVQSDKEQASTVQLACRPSEGGTTLKIDWNVREMNIGHSRETADVSPNTEPSGVRLLTESRQSEATPLNENRLPSVEETLPAEETSECQSQDHQSTCLSTPKSEDVKPMDFVPSGLISDETQSPTENTAHSRCLDHEVAIIKSRECTLPINTQQTSVDEAEEATQEHETAVDGQVENGHVNADQSPVLDHETIPDSEPSASASKDDIPVIEITTSASQPANSDSTNQNHPDSTPHATQPTSGTPN